MDDNRIRGHMVGVPRFNDPRGNLSFVEQTAPGGHCPFAIGSVAWLYNIHPSEGDTLGADTPHGALILALSGSFGCAGRFLRHCDRGWLSDSQSLVALADFSSNAVALMLEGCPDAAEPPAAEARPNSHAVSAVGQCRLIDLPTRRVAGAVSTWVDNAASPIPFAVRRIFYLYDVPAGASRGGHSHRRASEVMVALTGSFDVTLDDGKGEPKVYTLSRPDQGLYIPSGIWRTLSRFSGGSVCLVLTSDRYDEDDYVRGYTEFKHLTNP